MTVAIEKFTQDEDDQNPSSVPLLSPPVSFDDFVAWYPEHPTCHYELRNGVIIEMPKPRGQHSEVAGAIHDELALEIRRANLPYLIPKECLIKRSITDGYEPDVVVLDRSALANESLWSAASIIQNGAAIKLVIEVVSSNWQDDYELKMAEYESLGIMEYWIVDYAGLGGIRHIGKPKQPTLLIATMVEREYEVSMLRGDDPICSPTFPDLQLTAAQIMLNT
jgi:Uma2 family endonuclease